MRRVFFLVTALALVLTLAACNPAAPKADPYAARISTLQRQIEGLKDAVRTAGVVPQASTEMTSSATDRRVRALEDQLEILKEALTTTEVARLQPEPKRDVSSGTFLARFQSVASDGATTTATVDFITNAAVPWATKRDLQRSSWSEWIGWNKTKHPQPLRVSPRATLIVGDENGFTMSVVTPEEFAGDWDELDSDQKYFVHVSPASDGAAEISQVWPWIR